MLVVWCLEEVVGGSLQYFCPLGRGDALCCVTYHCFSVVMYS